MGVIRCSPRRVLPRVEDDMIWGFGDNPGAPRVPRVVCSVCSSVCVSERGGTSVFRYEYVENGCLLIYVR